MKISCDTGAKLFAIGKLVAIWIGIPLGITVFLFVAALIGYVVPFDVIRLPTPIHHAEAVAAGISVILAGLAIYVMVAGAYYWTYEHYQDYYRDYYWKCRDAHERKHLDE